MYTTKELFVNETEFDDSSSDYRKFAPQIMSDSSIGDYIDINEKINLKKHYNRTSLIMLLYTFSATAIVYGIGIILGFWRVITGSNDIDNYLGLPVITIALNIVIFLTINLLTYYIGCKVNKLNRDKFFETKDFGFWLCVIYVFTSLGIQYITGYAAGYIDNFMQGFGVENYSPEFETSTVPALILTVLYGCIIAPITEELLYRGFVLKSFSVVSQRTGIFVSALFFALSHQNIAQGLLAFPVGLLMGYIAVKHNSLVPGIIVHFFVNLFATICNELPRFNVPNEVYHIIDYVVIMGALICGIFFFMREHMPKKSRLQYPRTSLIYAAPLFWCYIGYNIYETVNRIIESNIN